MSTTPATDGTAGCTDGRQGRDEDVGAVRGHDDERAVDELLDEVLDAHRADAHVADLAVEALGRLDENLRAERRGHLADGRTVEVGLLARARRSARRARPRAARR